jgi:hypothetical protein
MSITKDSYQYCLASNEYNRLYTLSGIRQVF